MQKAVYFCLLVQAQALFALEKDPWLGNYLECKGTVEQELTRSKKVDLQKGKIRHTLHSDKTKASLAYMPKEDLGVAAELDLASTQSRSYGVDAIKAGLYYQWLNDLVADEVSLTSGIVATISPVERVHDLSSTNHSEATIQAEIAVGKEFAYKEKSFFRTWATGYVGKGVHGSTWLGFECHLDRVIDEKHTISAIFQAEKGLAHEKLKDVSRFRGWAKIGYEYEEFSLQYAYKHYWLGTIYASCAKRVHAKYCPSDLWRAQIGVIIPFSII